MEKPALKTVLKYILTEEFLVHVFNHPILICFLSKKGLYLCFQEQNRINLSCIEHILQNF